jgi:hypothetical protein
MAARFPLELFNVTFHSIARGFLTDDREHLGFSHSDLKLRKSFVHLAADAQQHYRRE